MVRFFVLLGVVCTLTLTACTSPDASSPSPDQTETAPTIPFDKEGTLTFLKEGEPLVTIDIEVADDDSSRTRGLMQRTSLPDLSGMFFIFPREEPQGFWMANTPLALDILYVNADSQIVRAAKYTRPFSQQTVESGAPAQYVIEVPAGFADTHGIVETDRVTWTIDN